MFFALNNENLSEFDSVCWPIMNGQEKRHGLAKTPISFDSICHTEPKPKYESVDGSTIGISAMSPDGKWIAVANNDKVKLWNMANWKAPPRLLTGHRGSLRCLQFS